MLFAEEDKKKMTQNIKRHFGQVDLGRQDIDEGDRIRRQAARIDFITEENEAIMQTIQANDGGQSSRRPLL